MAGGTSGSCNGGNIVGRSVGVAENGQSYTSLLNVTYNSALSGETIMCVHTTSTSNMVIGRSTIPEVLTGTTIIIVTYINNYYC